METAVDAPDLVERLFSKASRETALASLTTRLVNDRNTALERHGLTYDVLSVYLAYRHLPIPLRAGVVVPDVSPRPAP